MDTNMVSKRKFVMATILMVILFLILQCSLVIRDVENTYDVNSFVTDTGIDASSIWQPDVLDLDENDSVISYENKKYVLYVGNRDADVYGTVKDWCVYTKRNLAIADKLSSCEKVQEVLPECILIDGRDVAVSLYEDLFEKWTETGINLIFLTMPEYSKTERSPRLQQLLGIGQMMGRNQKVEGIRVVDQFFLGGEQIYEYGKKNVNEEYMDLDLTMDAYMTGSNTKTYIYGTFDSKNYTALMLPAIVWENWYNNAMVFVVNGDYMSTATGFGILDAFMYEMQEYVLYPVVNAQNVSLVNFPGLASENEIVMQRLYGRTQTLISQDVIWPDIIAQMRTGKLNFTCYLTPQFDYSDTNSPQTDLLKYYLMQFKEQDTEAGYSIAPFEDTLLSVKMEQDNAFYQSANSNYLFHTAYAKDRNNFINSTSYQMLSDVKNVLVDNDDSLFGFDTKQNDVLYTSVTADINNYTFTTDLQMRSLQTALGYSNAAIDMTDCIWPQEQKDEWENLAKSTFSKLLTYWKPYQTFDSLTSSQTDARIRNFLACDYQQTRDENQITIDLKNSKEAYFILRTHNEKVSKLEGGSFQKIEDGAYLIHVTSPKVTIMVKSTIEE